MNLFLVICLTQIQMRNSIQKYLHVHRMKTINESTNQFSQEFISYVIQLKYSEQQILQSCDNVVEHFAFMHFELFDQTDYEKAISPKIDQVHQILSQSKSQYSLIRDISKSSELIKENFYKFVWKEIIAKKSKLVLQKGGIIICANSPDLEIGLSPNSTPSKQDSTTKRNYRKQVKLVDLQKYSREILKLRWNLSFDKQKLF